MSEPIHIPNINNYTQEIINGELILTPKKNITDRELNMVDLTHSSILECKIKNNAKTISTKTKFRRVLIDIWKSMPTSKLLQTTSFNLKLKDEKGLNGYNWCDDIRMSFQNKDARGTLNEIVRMIKVNKYTFELTIKLNTGQIINYKIE